MIDYCWLCGVMYKVVSDCLKLSVYSITYINLYSCPHAHTSTVQTKAISISGNVMRLRNFLREMLTWYARCVSPTSAFVYIGILRRQKNCQVSHTWK